MINTPCFIHPSVASKPHHFILKASLTKHPALCCCQHTKQPPSKDGGLKTCGLKVQHFG